MVKLEQITWPQEYSELQRIEELLLCGICYEYMDTSVMTPCSHNFCSLCIRKYLHYKTQCPACFEKTFEKDLHTNRILDEIILYFGKIRLKLASGITGAKICPNEETECNDNPSSSTPVRPARTNQSSKKPSPKIETEQKETVNITLKAEKVDTTVFEQQRNISSPSTSGSQKVAKIFTPKSKKSVADVTTSGKTVPCPVCAVDVSESHINKHLDACLKRETVKETTSRPEVKRKPIPKLVFSLMKDTELRKKMKSLGLPTQGDRKTLESRFMRYCTLYNAECDKKEPRPIEELLKQCENDECLEKKMVKFAQAANRLKVTRNSENNVIEEAQKKYLEANRQSYQKLIDEMKARPKNDKPSVRRALVEDGQSFRENGDIHDLSTGSEDDRVNYSATTYEVTFQDSDSNSSYPLQHYTSEIPANYLLLEMTESDNSVSPSKAPQSKNLSGQITRAEVPVSPMKNISLDETGDSSSKSSPENMKVYCASTDKETSDDDGDVVPPSPNATINNTNKRAKFSFIRTSQSPEICTDITTITEGQKLAMSIAQDFMFDSSSNDSLERDTPSDNLEMLMSERATENNIILKNEKENDESSVLKLGKEDDEKLLVSPRIVSPLKRRRRQKVMNNEVENSKPPSRPLRRRLINSLSADEMHK